MSSCTKKNTIRKARKTHECMFHHVIEEGDRYIETKLIATDGHDTDFYTYRRCLICMVITPICEGGVGAWSATRDDFVTTVNKRFMGGFVRCADGRGGSPI